MHHDPLLQILILLTASVCVVAGVRKLGLPAILGYLAVGMLLGPHAFALAQDSETTQLLADFGVVFLVFTLGLEFSLPRLVAMRWEVLGVGGAQVLITTGIVAAGAVLLFGVALPVAVVIGGTVAMSSTAIVIAQLTEQSENNRTHGRLAVAICLFQDLSFPLFLALVSVQTGGGTKRRRRARARRRRNRGSRTAAGAGRRTLAAASAVSAHRRGALRGTVFAGRAAGGAGFRLGHPRGGPVARPRRLSRRHDAGGNRVSPSGRGDDPLLSRSAAGAVLHHRRHAARRRIAAAAFSAGDGDSGRHAAAQGRGGDRGRQARDQELVQVIAHGRGGRSGRGIRIRTVDAAAAARIAGPGRGAAAAGGHRA